MLEIDKIKHLQPVRIAQVNINLNYLVVKGCYSISEAIKSRGQMFRYWNKKRKTNGK